MIVIDTTDRIMGRVGAMVAKMLLSGENVVIVNADKAVITGDPKMTNQKFLQKRQRGDRKKGPFYPRYPAPIMRRAVRGMLPIRKARGRTAYRRLKVFADQPAEYKKAKKIGKALSEIECKFCYIKDVAKFLGAKV
jgi:large subunit ribosomal protein L13